MSIAINNDAASEALTQLVPLIGEFPARDGGQATFIPLGSIRTFAGSFAIGGSAVAEGQLLNISQNTALFSLFGTFYGGDGVTTFALPDLSRRTLVDSGQGPGLSDLSLGVPLGSEAVTLSTANLPGSVGGGGQPFNNYQPSLPVSYVINVSGFFPSPTTGAGSVAFLGNIVPFAGNFAPAGYLPTDGRLLDIAQHEDLFSILGTKFGGDGVTTFALPDLRGRTIIGTSSQEVGLGQTVGQGQVTVTTANLPASFGGTGQPIDNREPSLGLTFLIATEGFFPSQPGSGSVDPSNPYLGEVIAFAGDFAPKGWAPADGRLLSITGNIALFAVIGTQYGGDGITTFALPDLRNRAVLGTGGGLVPGSVIGANPLVLSADEINAIVNAPQDISGGAGNDSLSGADGNDSLQSGPGDDLLFGMNGDDRLDGGDGNDRLEGGVGRDALLGEGGDDQLVGGDGEDQMIGGAGFDLMLGGANGDRLEGGDGNDRLEGEDGNDTLLGEAGIDLLLAGTGDDQVYGGTEGDRLEGGEGRDSLAGEDGDDQIVGGTEDDYLFGGLGADLILGEAGTDFVVGDAGDDRLEGGAGNDQMYGFDGNDIIVGGAGDDAMNGGAGNDIFVFEPGFGHDQIFGFAAGQGTEDRLSLVGLGFTSFDDVLARTTDAGAGAVITVDAANTITLFGVTKASLAAEDILLA